jgi:hypothetical protein
MADPMEGLQRVIDSHMGNGGPVRLLEAGCGSMSKVRLGDNVQVVGTDISAQQVARNESLHERILGDIQTYPIPERSFLLDVLARLDAPRAGAS